MSTDQVKEQERMLVKRAATANLSPELYAAWDSCKTCIRTPCHQNKIFVIWSFDDSGSPVVHGGLTVKKLGVDSLSGTTAILEVDTDLGGGTYRVGHSPVNLLSAGLWCYAPFLNTVSFVRSQRSERPVARLSLVFKQEAGNLDKEPDLLRLSSISEFRFTYPQFKGLHL